MAETKTKKYPVECPGPYCGYEWEHEADPEIVEGPGDDCDLITCPECLEEWDWSYNGETEEIILEADELTEEDLDLDTDDEEDFEDEEDDDSDEKV